MDSIFENFGMYVTIFNIFFLLLIIFIEKKRPVSALFWISLLVFVPYLGFFLFLFFGLKMKNSRIITKFYERKFSLTNRKNKKEENSLLLDNKNIIDYLKYSGAGEPSSYTDSLLFNNGETFFNNLFTDIENATKSIQMEYFVFKEDELGKTFYSLLLKKASQGVDIKLIIDGVNSTTYWRQKALREAGINIKLFFPSLLPWLKIVNLRANYRDHRKITIIDGKIGYIGGFNIGNEYLGDGKLGKWRDTAVRLQGNIVSELYKEFIVSWNFVRKSSKKKTFFPEIEPIVYPPSVVQNASQLVSSGPNFETRTARDNFLNLILNAKKTIYLETPYFVPDDTILDALKIAALSGVDIQIIIPNKPDHLFIYWVNQAYAWDLIKYGVKFSKYNTGFIHSKMMIVDNKIATLGSTNLDYRSFYQNFEININIYSGELLKELEIDFLEDLKDSTPLTLRDYGQRTIVIKMKESIFRLFAPLM